MESNPYELVDQAWDLRSAGRHAEAAEMARRAIAQNPDDIDAFVILAHSTPLAAERMALLREGVRLGEIQHANELKDPGEYTFWGDIDTRPYMRALHGLALDLWRVTTPASRREAVKIGEHMLRINPRDNQGIRFLLMHWYGDLARWSTLAPLLRKHSDDHRTETLYWRALIAFRDNKDDADERLAEAIALNPHVPAMIAGAIPDGPEGDSVTFRSPEEAASYASYAHPVWASVLGAREWIGKKARRNR